MRGNVDHDAASRLMGVVANSEGPLIIVGVSPSQLADGSEVMVSIFTQEGLYRMRATSHWDGDSRLRIDPIHETERVQRRDWPCHPLHLEVVLASLDGDSGDVTGQTPDPSVGGLRVATDRCLPRGPQFIIDPPGRHLVSGRFALPFPKPPAVASLELAESSTVNPAHGARHCRAPAAPMRRKRDARSLPACGFAPLRTVAGRRRAAALATCPACWPPVRPRRVPDGVVPSPRENA
jgi:hypothetical protein